ncbi:hypothetical protein [Sphingobium sp. MK2]|uniref:hypothetical protein n=1 Tax=Sphingobium sp. MK2 TaxID=3116540 RepID=UPI0032E3662D
MKSYPIYMARRSYRGSDPKKRGKINEFNRVAGRVEDYLNADLAQKADHTINTYLSYSIAHNVGEDSALVHEIVFATDCGSNGITIVKGDFDKAMQRMSSPPEKAIDGEATA